MELQPRQGPPSLKENNQMQGLITDEESQLALAQKMFVAAINSLMGLSLES